MGLHIRVRVVVIEAGEVEKHSELVEVVVKVMGVVNDELVVRVGKPLHTVEETEVEVEVVLRMEEVVVALYMEVVVEVMNV